MIVKMGADPGFEYYAMRHNTVKALLMPEPFLLETSLGYLKGSKGDYVVEVALGVRFACTAIAFLKTHARLAPEGCDRRCGPEDRRTDDVAN